MNLILILSFLNVFMCRAFLKQVARVGENHGMKSFMQEVEKSEILSIDEVGLSLLLDIST